MNVYKVGKRVYNLTAAIVYLGPLVLGKDVSQCEHSVRYDDDGHDDGDDKRLDDLLRENDHKFHTRAAAAVYQPQQGNV